MTQKFFDSSIAHKIMLLVMSIILSILLLSFLCFLAYDVYFNTRQAITNEIELVARAVSKRAAPVMIFEDQYEGNKVISEVSIKDSIILACLYTDRKSLLSEYRQDPNQPEYCPDNAPEESGIISRIDSIAIHKDVVSPNGEKVASIYIVSDIRQMLHKLFYTSMWAMAFLGLALWLSYLLVMKITTVVTSPLLNLADTAKAVSRHDYSARARKMYDDECGLLTDAFNEMMQKVEDHKKTLNQIVDKRTKDLRHTVRELERTNEELEKANRLKQIWIQNMGHEIRTPIHQVLQFSNFGMQEYNDDSVDREEIGTYFSRIQLSANRLCKLIEGLLDFGKLQSGKIMLAPALHNLEETVTNVVDELYGMASDKQIDVRVRKPEFPTQFIFDNNRISQVVINLLANAIKFSPKEGVIEILFAKTKLENEDAVEVSIKDEGIGIPEGEEESIFDTFTQSSKTYDGSGGTGLGLSISREIVLLHGGVISAKNNNGVDGAVFQFTLPLRSKVGESNAP